MDLNGMKQQHHRRSVWPCSAIVREMWLNWDAARVLDMLKGSYLFDADPARIIQDSGELASLLHSPGLRLGKSGPRSTLRSYFRSIHPTTTLRCMSDWGLEIPGSLPPRR